MSYFRKILPIGAAILGTSYGGISAYCGSSSNSDSSSRTTGYGSATTASGKTSTGQLPGRADRTIPMIERDDLELKFVQIFFRHGARTPLRLIPNVEEGHWDCDTLFNGASHMCIDYKVCDLQGGPRPEWHTEKSYRRKKLKGGSYRGQLTAKGMQQAFDLGVQLRRHYRDKLGFLPDDFSTDCVYPRSTNINRTLQSLACLLGGLYGDSIKEPVTLFVDHSAAEILYPNSGSCEQLLRHYSSVFSNVFSIPGIRHAVQQFTPLLDIKEEDWHKFDFIGLRDDFTARVEHNLHVPHFLLPLTDLIEKYAVAVTKYLIEGSGPPQKEIIRFSAGPTIHYLTQTLESASKKQIPYKLHLNSCHDTTLMTILLAFDAYDDVWPPLTACMTFELYEDKAGKAYVRTLYEDKELHICNSKESLIPLETFKELVAPVSYTKEEHHRDCNTPVSHTKEEHQKDCKVQSQW